MTGFCFRTYRINKGFTLVELMVAMVIGAFFLNGILQIFSSSKQIYRMQENLARLQENGRFAIDFISQDIRMAGYWGCYPKVPSTAGLSNPGFFHKLEPALEGFEAKPSETWAPDLHSAFIKPWLDDVLEGSDILVIRKMGAQGFSVTNHASALGNLQLAATSEQLDDAEITEGSVVIASDCTHAEAFQVTNTTNPLEHVVIADTNETDTAAATPGNKPDNLTNIYQGAKVHAVNVVSYYVATNANNEKLLYRRTNGAVKPDELQLIDGVEQMQVLYGVDTNADLSPDYYVNADDVNKNNIWDKVIAVRISLLVATLDDYVAEKTLPLPYPFDEKNKNIYDVIVPPPIDRKIRRAFTTTIALRNPPK